jgi:hypothetical protein
MEAGVQLQVWRVRIFRECLNLSDDSKQERHQSTGNDKLENHMELCKKAATRSERNPLKGESFSREIKVMERVSQCLVLAMLWLGYVLRGLRNHSQDW